MRERGERHITAITATHHGEAIAIDVGHFVEAVAECFHIQHHAHAFRAVVGGEKPFAVPA